MEQGKNNTEIHWQWIGVLAVVHAAFALIYGVQTMADSKGYISAGKDLIGFWNSAHVLRTPGYPAFVALCGSYYPLIIVLQHAMVIWMAWLAFRLVEPVDERAAKITFWAIGLHPWFAYWANAIMTEILAAICIVGVLYLLFRQHPVWAGLLTGYAILVRPASLPALLALVAGSYLYTRKKRDVALAVLASTLVLAPWLARNYRNANYIGISPIGEMTLWSKYAALTGIEPDLVWPEIDRVIQEKGEVGGNHYFKQQAFQIIQQHPIGALALNIRSAKAFLAYDLVSLVPSIQQDWNKPLSDNTMLVLALKIFFQYILPLTALSLFVYGALLSYRETNMAVALIMLSGLVAVIQFVGIGDTRLRIPSEPLFMIFIALGVSTYVSKRKEPMIGLS